MYKDHFQLRAMPFSIAPDPSFFYLSNQHRDACLHLGHALNGDAAVVLLTGEVGAGKTTVCKRLLDELPAHVQVALIFNARLTVQDLLLALCRQFSVGGVDETAPLDTLEAQVVSHVAQRAREGHRSVLIIDEAQGLSDEALEALRRLRAAAWDEKEGLRLVLIGQPELNEHLSRPGNAGFERCITLRYHLGPLGQAEVAAYVSHRLSVAGGRKQLFPSRLIGPLHRMSGGIPRVINLICDRALLGTFVLGERVVTRRILNAAWEEASGQEPMESHWPRYAFGAFAASALLAAGAALAMVMRPTPAATLHRPQPPVTADATTAGLDPKNPSDWPDGMAGRPSEALAFAALLRRWEAQPQAGMPACRAAASQGLMCVQGRDEIEALRRLDMPAVLQLVDRQGRQSHVALVQVRGKLAVLQLGNAVRSVPIPVLESQWTRHYTVVWRPPSAAQGVATPGGPPVPWLRERLAQLRGEDAMNLPARLEGRLKSALQEFQMLEGLPASGDADLRTLMHLASRTEPLAPSLEARQCGE